MFTRQLVNILGRFVLIIWLVLRVRTYDYNPSWKSLLEKLHNKVDEIYQGDRTITVLSGKYFKYHLKDSNDFVDYEAFEEGTTALPKWLSFNPKKKKLQGIPTDDDIRTGLKIVFRRKHQNTVNGLFGEPQFVILNIVSNRQPFKCSQTIATGSLIFSYDIRKRVGKDRITLLREIATQLEQPINNLYLEIGNRLDNDVSLGNGIQMAGPGDRVTNNGPGFTITWKIKCSKDIRGDKVIPFLKQLSSAEDFSSTFKEPVMGWFVHFSDDQSYRIRRAIGLGGTPVATPSQSAVVVKPTISPSPSASTKPSVVVKPTPSKSVVVEKTSVVTTAPPVITRASTMAPTTEKETEKLTTPVEITTKPTTIKVETKEPTKEPTTEPTKEPTTEPKKETTKEPTKESTEELTKEPTKETTKGVTKQPPKVATTISKVKLTNSGPILKNEIKRITLFAYQAEMNRLENLFHDPENDPLTIELRYYPNKTRSIPSQYDSWIEYKDKNLYLLPKKAHVGIHTFELTATDHVSGKYVNDVFTVVVHDDKTFYNILFNITVNADFSQVNQSAQEQVKLVKDIALATNEVDYKKLREVRFFPGSVIVQWGVDHPDFLRCKNEVVENYFKYLDSDDFRTSFPLAGVLGVGMLNIKSCDDSLLLPSVANSDDNLWQRILIPVIVIIVLLLIIALILCCVYRRRRKGSMNAQEDKAYLNHKKPVIFLEEFEEKPHFLSLQPLILPNEKPPATDHPYEPRADTPEGPGSSAESTQSEEKPLTPQSPKDSSRKGYNAPPPYNSLS